MILKLLKLLKSCIYKQNISTMVIFEIRSANFVPCAVQTVHIHTQSVGH